MPAKAEGIEYEIVVGAAYLVKNILHKLGFVQIIDEVLTHQPARGTTYGQLDQVFGVEAMLEALASHRVRIWSWLVQYAVERFKVDLAQLHNDTSSVYFEGQYENKQSQPLGGGSGCRCWWKGTTKTVNDTRFSSC